MKTVKDLKVGDNVYVIRDYSKLAFVLKVKDICLKPDDTLGRYIITLMESDGKVFTRDTVMSFATEYDDHECRDLSYLVDKEEVIKIITETLEEAKANLKTLEEY